MTMQLSPTQQQILRYAAERTDGRLIWFPDNIKGGARAKVIGSLSKRGLITPDEADWIVSEQGYAALGLPHTPKSRSRDNSKQAQVIAMLKRPEGATIHQLCEITGWQSHTMRGTLAGKLKKKLGLTITSEKPEGCDRTYHIQ
jgi:hypothetical protein